MVAATGFVAVAVFQVALALGAPLGAAAWGGAESVLSPERRVSSGVAAVILLVEALIVCGRAGMLAKTAGWMRVFRVGIWVVVAQLALNTLANLASSSPYERYGMSLVTLALAGLCAAVARSTVGAPGSAREA